jgi:hypothetical protein
MDGRGRGAEGQLAGHQDMDADVVDVLAVADSVEDVGLGDEADRLCTTLPRIIDGLFAALTDPAGVAGHRPAGSSGCSADCGSPWCDGLVDEELLELGPRRPAPVRWLAILATVLALVAVTTHAVRRSAVSSTPRAATPRTVGTVSATVPSNGPIALPAVSQRPFPIDTTAVILGELPQFAALERTDGTAAQGPSSLVVRRRDGSLGRHGAVITYPVSPPAWGHPVRVGRAIGTAVAGGFVWPLAGKYARIRSDLPPQKWFASLSPRRC